MSLALLLSAPVPAVFLLSNKMRQSQKRKQAETKPASGLAELDHVVLDCIKSKDDQAILDRNIGKETKLPIAVAKKCIKTLQALTLIKQIPRAQFKGKHYIAPEITPADNVTGGIWYIDGQLDTEFINQLKDLCFQIKAESSNS